MKKLILQSKRLGGGRGVGNSVSVERDKETGRDLYACMYCFLCYVVYSTFLARPFLLYLFIYFII